MNLNKVVRWIVFSLVVCLIGLALITYPLIRDRYRFKKLADRVQSGMSRDKVVRLAEEIGYHNHDIEVPGQGRIESINNQPMNKIVDVYYFRNIMIDDVILIRYDAEGRVKTVHVDY